MVDRLLIQCKLFAYFVTKGLIKFRQFSKTTNYTHTIQMNIWKMKLNLPLKRLFQSTQRKRTRGFNLRCTWRLCEWPMSLMIDPREGEEVARPPRPADTRKNEIFNQTSRRRKLIRFILFSFLLKTSALIWSMEVKLPALLGNYDRQTNQPFDRPTSQPTDGQTGSLESFTSNMFIRGRYGRNNHVNMYCI